MLIANPLVLVSGLGADYAIAFQAFYVSRRVAQLAQDASGMLAQQRRERPDSCRSAIEPGRGPGLSYSAEPGALVLFEDLTGANLRVLQQLEAAPHRPGWNVIGK